MPFVGNVDVPWDWPVTGEPAKTFRDKLNSGFFSRFLSGDKILDVGFRGDSKTPVPILPQAIGIDLDYPGYDGLRLPADDGTVDSIYSSHMLEHADDYRSVIWDWFRVIRVGGFIVCVVPHQFLYEKKNTLPSIWNSDHKRFYTPASLVGEFEEALEPNSYRIRHLADNDRGYRYDIGLAMHPVGSYEIELVIEKIQRPVWVMS